MPRTSPSELTISVTTSPQPPLRLTSRRNAVSVMPAIGASATGWSSSNGADLHWPSLALRARRRRFSYICLVGVVFPLDERLRRAVSSRNFCVSTSRRSSRDLLRDLVARPCRTARSFGATARLELEDLIAAASSAIGSRDFAGLQLVDACRAASGSGLSSVDRRRSGRRSPWSPTRTPRRPASRSPRPSARARDAPSIFSLAVVVGGDAEDVLAVDASRSARSPEFRAA